MAGLFVLGRLEVAYLYAAAFALALISLAFDVATIAVIPELAGSDRQLVRANGAHQAVMQAGSIGGPVLAGVMLALVGAAQTLWIDAASFAGTFVAVFTLPAFRGATPADRPVVGLLSGLREGLGWLWHCPPLRALGLQALMGNIGFGMVNAVLLFYLRDTLGVSTEQAGLDFAFLEAGGLLGTLAIIPLERRFRRGSLYTGLILWGIAGLTTIVTVRDWWGPGLGMAMVISCNLAWAVLSTSVRQELIPPELRGRVVSLGRVVASLTLPLGATLGGLLAQAVSPTAVFLVAIGTSLIELLIIRCSTLRRL
jgi:Na+/melibiose symporter-like transporter